MIGDGGIGKADAQGILLVCQLLGDVAGVGPRGLGVGRVGGASVAGGLVVGSGQQGRRRLRAVPQSAGEGAEGDVGRKAVLVWRRNFDRNGAV